jgi:hypothetical protein
MGSLGKDPHVRRCDHTDARWEAQRRRAGFVLSAQPFSRTFNQTTLFPERVLIFDQRQINLPVRHGNDTAQQETAVNLTLLPAEAGVTAATADCKIAGIATADRLAVGRAGF